MKKFFYLILILIFCAFVNACKIKYSLSGATIPPEAKTISVGFFANNTSLGAPSLSQRFTEKLRDMVSSQTSLGLVSNNGDLQFEGYISDFNVSPVGIQSTDKANLNRLTINVSVKYSNRFDAGKSFEQSFSRFADFDAAASINDKEAELVQEIFRQITEDIFNRAFNNW